MISPTLLLCLMARTVHVSRLIAGLVLLILAMHALAQDIPDARRKAEGQRAYDQRRFGQAYALWEPLAERGDVLLQMELGAMITSGAVPDNALGQGYSPDGRRAGNPREWAAAARAWFEKAARNPAASSAVAAAAWNGAALTLCCWPRFDPSVKLTDEEWRQSMAYFDKAAELGNAAALFSLGEIWSLRMPVARDDDRALDYLRRAQAHPEQSAEVRERARRLAAAVDERRRTEAQQAQDARQAAEEAAQRARLVAQERRRQYEAQQLAEQQRQADERERERLAREKDERERPAREAAQRAAAAQAQRDLEREQLRQQQECERVTQSCRGLVFAGKPLIETIANNLRTHPGSIRLDRTSVQKGWAGCACMAVFWTPTGTLECTVRSASGLTVTDASCAR
jgi:TPR repeat protein